MQAYEVSFQPSTRFFLFTSPTMCTLIKRTIYIAAYHRWSQAMLTSQLLLLQLRSAALIVDFQRPLIIVDLLIIFLSFFHLYTTKRRESTNRRIRQALLLQLISSPQQKKKERKEVDCRLVACPLPFKTGQSRNSIFIFGSIQSLVVTVHRYTIMYVFSSPQQRLHTSEMYNINIALSIYSQAVLTSNPLDLQCRSSSH